MPKPRYSISTIYGGRQVDSLLEGRWAAFFDLLGWGWEPQPETAFGVWRPDFRLTVPLDGGGDWEVYVEVKPQEYIQEAWERIDQSSYEGPALIVGNGPFESAGRYAIGEFRQDRQSHSAFLVDGHNHYRELNGYWNTIANSIRPRPGKARQGERPPELFRIELPAGQGGADRPWLLAETDRGDSSPQLQEATRYPAARGEVARPSPPVGRERRTVAMWAVVAGGGIVAVGVAVVLLLVLLTDSEGGDGEFVADRDCADFSTQEEAQRFYEEQGGPQSDIHRLDEDDDGLACEGLRVP